MMRYNYNQHSNNENSEINISPLVDMVFLLLIFFIVTTVFIEETGIEVQKPMAASAQSLEKKRKRENAEKKRKHTGRDKDRHSGCACNVWVGERGRWGTNLEFVDAAATPSMPRK